MKVKRVKLESRGSGELGRVHERDEAVGGPLLGVVGGGSGGAGGGWFDDRVVGVVEGGGPVDGVGLMGFEADLSAEGPGALDPGVVGEGAK